MRPAFAHRSLSLAALACLAACGREPLEPGLVTWQQADPAPLFGEWSAPTNVGDVVNSAWSDFDPAISRDGLTLYFVGGNKRGGSGGRDLWVAVRDGVHEPWSAAMNLGGTVNSGAHESKPTLSLDGHRLYFASNRAGGLGGFDLYVSRRKDAGDPLGWQEPVNLGPLVNSGASEESAVAILEHAAGATLYFASDRDGGLGDFDIYAAPLGEDGVSGPATLVPSLSSAAGDIDPTIRRDGLELFLASDREGTYGAMDLWVANRPHVGDDWSAPVNLGLTVNSAPRPEGEEQANDMRPALSFDGRSLYFNSAFREGNVGGPMFDIWVTTRVRLLGPGS